MKAILSKKILLVTCFLTLVVAGASSALAFPSNNTNCDGCHITTDVLTLTSNATGTVDATVGVPFVLSLNAADGVELLKIVSALENNDQFTFSLSEVEDNGDDDASTDAGVVNVDVTVTPLAAGTFTIRIWVAAPSQLSKSLDISVDVSENTDTTFTPTPTPTTPTETTTDPIETWRTMMYLLNPIVAVMLIVFAFVIFKRSK
ncbi:MAG: hypothetical protein P1Q69_08455 [Candidatus Thorarchaeota archaeon]|nr:hypothetical protein [Candidatus Thorarchaeota archaeon]